MPRLEAGVRKHPDGTLEKRFTVNGKRYSVYGKTSKEIALNGQEIRKKIERREILTLQKEASKKLSITSCNILLTILKIVLNDAVKDEVIHKNPANSVKTLKQTGKKAAENRPFLYPHFYSNFTPIQQRIRKKKSDKER